VPHKKCKQVPITTNAFNLSADLVYQTLPRPPSHEFSIQCDLHQFYLAVPDVARFLVFSESNRILIEKASSDISAAMIHTWLYGTVFAYLLQYHGYLVLHGSAVLMNHRAVMFGGHSGAGKSTLAHALLQQGYPFITDDLIVIKRDDQGQYGILPGPAKLKLWKDAMLHFNQDVNNALPVHFKTDKYTIPVELNCNSPTIPVAAFYELNLDKSATRHTCERLHTHTALKTLMQNAYRYFMLKPLGKLQTFFQDCSALNQEVTVHKVIRPPCFDELPKLIETIEFDQGISP